MNNKYTFWELCNTYNKIEVPIIQRDYAQGRNTVEVQKLRNRFVNDYLIESILNNEKIELDFVYGSILFEAKGDDKQKIFIPLDGQQRLTTLFLLNLVLSFLMFKFKSLRVLVQSEPITLIFKGKVLEKNLKAVMISEEELLSAIREHGIENVADVSLSMLEPDGNISVISGNDTHLKRTQYKRKKHHKTLQDI